MQKGFLLYVRFNRNWTEVYGPFSSVRKAMDHTLAAPGGPKLPVKTDEHFASWCLAVPVADGEKLL